MTTREIATQFGRSLDQDDYATTRKTLAEDCIYHIGEEKIVGPLAIAKSYEDNMIEGRKKLDKLEWGTCSIEEISETSFYVHFTDYLTHQSQSYTHRCKQKIRVGDNHKIIAIEHIADPEAQERLNAYYRMVGLK